MVVVMVPPWFWQIFQAIAFPVFEGQRQVKMSTALLATAAALLATAAALPATSSSSAPPSSASSSPSPSSSPSSSTRARLLEDVKKDIAKYVHVTPEDKARCAIASGADFGRLGLPVDVSTMERLLLGEAPCHQIIFKLSALKGGGVLGTRSKANKHGRDRMMGHSIIFPHFVMGERRGEAFSLDAIKAAFSAVRLVLVGPQDQRAAREGRLENLRPARAPRGGVQLLGAEPPTAWRAGAAYPGGLPAPPRLAWRARRAPQERSHPPRHRRARD